MSQSPYVGKTGDSKKGMQWWRMAVKGNPRWKFTTLHGGQGSNQQKKDECSAKRKDKKLLPATLKLICDLRHSISILMCTIVLQMQAVFTSSCIVRPDTPIHVYTPSSIHDQSTRNQWYPSKGRVANSKEVRRSTSQVLTSTMTHQIIVYLARDLARLRDGPV